VSAVPELRPADPRTVRELLEDLCLLLNSVSARVDMMSGSGSVGVQNLAKATQADLTQMMGRIAWFIQAHPAPEQLPLDELARRVLGHW
jgi:hypothetical protein